MFDMVEEGLLNDANEEDANDQEYEGGFREAVNVDGGHSPRRIQVHAFDDHEVVVERDGHIDSTQGH